MAKQMVDTPIKVRERGEGEDARVYAKAKLEEWRQKKELLVAQRTLCRTQGEFVVSRDGLLLHRGESASGHAVLEYVIPASQRMAAIIAAHDCMAHVGRARTLDALRVGRMWWPTMDLDVRHYIGKECPTCALNKLGPHVGEMQIPPNGGSPWSVATVDVVDLEDTVSGYRKAIVFADRFGRGVRCFPAKETFTSRDFINTIVFGLMAEGIRPRLLIPDRESRLISKLCGRFYAAFGITVRPLDAHMHTGVGLCERFNSTLRALARAAWFDNAVQWDLYLPWLVAIYNGLVNSTTGYTPFYIEHGRESVLPWQIMEELPGDATSVDEFVRGHMSGLHLAWDAALQAIETAEEKRKVAHDATRQTNVSFTAGERVCVLQPGRQSKMEMPFIGPYRVVKGPDARDRYTLRDKRNATWPVFHVSKLKLWPETAEQATDLQDEYFVVSHILDKREEGGEVEYQVRWQGYGKGHDSWVPRIEMNVHLLAAADEYDSRAAPAVSSDTAGASDDGAAADEEGEPGAEATGAATEEATAAPPAAEASQGSQGRDARAATRGSRMWADVGGAGVAQRRDDPMRPATQVPVPEAVAESERERQEETIVEVAVEQDSGTTTSSDEETTAAATVPDPPSEGARCSQDRDARAAARGAA